MADGNSDKANLLAHQPYDESVSVYGDDEEIESELTPSPRVHVNTGKRTDPMNQSLLDSEEEFEHDNMPQPQKNPTSRPAGGHVIVASDDEEDDEGSESSEDEKEENNEGAYNPSDYEHLPVSVDIKELFQYIGRYTPHVVELEHKLKPFIPDYIPAVGDIDAFIKVTRPDGKPETLGLKILDEPSADQSDPTVLDLQLRSISKQTTAKQMIVRSVEEPEKNPKAIDNWVNNIAKLHRDKPPQTVHYTKTMPDIETLMQEWPEEFEELLKTANLPSADLNCQLKDYIDIICSMLDIPVHNNRVQSLHVLFTLYSEFKNSQHFNQLANDNVLSNELKHAQSIPNKALNNDDSFE